jgi:hypothetical protein
MTAGKLKGKSLSLVIGLVGAVGFVLQGYDQAVANGLLTLGSFIAVFPEIDTVHTTGSQKSHNSTIQGIYLNRQNFGNPKISFLISQRYNGRYL